MLLREIYWTEVVEEAVAETVPVPFTPAMTVCESVYAAFKSAVAVSIFA
jgi:hypothetical protein